MVLGAILRNFLFLIFDLNKDKGWGPDSPCEINNSKIPSLSMSATAAPVPKPFFSKAFEILI